jgi:hypothetical protein
MNPWPEWLSLIATPREYQYDDGKLAPRKDWPTDYSQFLQATRGCDFLPEKAPALNVPIPWNKSRSVWSELCVLYGEGDSREERGWLSVTDVSFPREVVAIGKFGDSSLAAISLRPSDQGSIYYWDWYHDYPWRGDFYRRRANALLRRIPDIAHIADDPNHPRHQEILDACNEVYLVKIADSFTELLSLLTPAKNP